MLPMQMVQLSQGSLEYVWSDTWRMCKTKKLTIRVSAKQYSLIVNRMENFGYRILSQYARECMIRDDLSTYKLLKDIHKKIIGTENEKTPKKI